MGRHIKPLEWLELINMYNNNVKYNELYEKYLSMIDEEHTEGRKYSFFKTLRYRTKLYNLGMTYSLTSKKDPALKKKRGRPKNQKIKNEKGEINWDAIPIEDLKEIAKRYYEITNKLDKKSLISEAEKLNIHNNIKFALFNISRQTLAKRRNAATKTANIDKSICNIYKEEIAQLRSKYKNFGREKLAQYLKKDYGIEVNSRTLGRYLSKNNMNSHIRKPKKAKEIKDTRFAGKDLMKRDYNDISGQNIKSTDVTYIPATKDAPQNHIYLSVVMDNKTKLIIGYKFSYYNNMDLVMDTMLSLPLNEPTFIMHSDNGFQYTHEMYRNLIESKNGKCSYSRTGNSLDNREIEYWFSIYKTEFLPYIDCKLLTLEELDTLTGEFINFYNNERIQSNLEWKTPAQYALMYKNNFL
ncbi:transposase [Mycoplasma aquilae ATCC BAA-1896]|uniref:transposase n=2 Tax=Mycoplasma aquilae TaxID=1312741 RepID=UPI003A870FC0